MNLISFKGAKLLHQFNIQFLEKQTIELDQKEEIYRNINRIIGIPTFPYRTQSTYDFLVALVFGLPIFLLAAWALSVAFIALFHYPPNATLKDYFLHIAFVVGVSIVGSVGYDLLKFAFLSKNPFVRRTEKYYKDLINNGIVTEGEIINFDSYSHPNININYRLKNPQGKEIEGQYTTSIYHKFKEGDKAVIFYLNDKLHILL